MKKKVNFSSQREATFESMMDEIRNKEVFTKAQIRNMIAEYQETGNAALKQKVVESHLMYLAQVVQREIQEGEDIMELMSEGTEALDKAVEHYNMKSRLPFVSYCTTWILKAISQYRNQPPMGITRIPEMEDVLDNEASYMSEIQVWEKRRKRVYVESLSQPVYNDYEDDDEYTQEDIISLDNQKEQEERERQAEIKWIVNNSLKMLKKKEAEVLRCSFGLNGKKYTDLEIATLLGYQSPKTVKRVREDALSKLRSRLECFM